MSSNNAMLYLLGGAAIGIGAYWYISKSLSCAASILGGPTTEYECKLREILQIGCPDACCLWDPATQTCTGGIPTYCQQFNQENDCIAHPECEYCPGSPAGYCIEKTIGCGGVMPCQIGYNGDCNFPDKVECDGNNNSCKCVPNSQSSTGYRLALESPNAYNCVHDVRYKDCFVALTQNPNNLSICQETAGAVPLVQCHRAFTQIGCPCPCAIGQGGAPFFCSGPAINNKCYQLMEGLNMHLLPENVTKTRENGFPVWTYKVPQTNPIAPPYDVPFAAGSISNIVIGLSYPPGCMYLLGGANVRIKFKDYNQNPTTYEVWGNGTILFHNCTDPITEEQAHIFPQTRVIDEIQIRSWIDVNHPELLEITSFEAQWSG